MDTRDSQSIPKPALLLGLAGLLPFAATAILSWVGGTDLQARAGFALAAYGAVILSFLGGIKWGAVLYNQNDLQHWGPLGLSVAPSILAWFALLFSVPVALALLTAGLLGQFYLDRQSVNRNELPGWFGRLRLMLTTGAVVCTVAGLLALVS